LIQKEEFQFKRACGLQALGREILNLPRQRMARVGGHGSPVQFIKRQEHFGARRGGVVQRFQCAGHRPCPQIAVALIPDQAGFMHILAADIQPQNGNRHMPSRAIERQEFMPPDDLARPMPLESCKTISTASISGWAARNSSASEISAPEGQVYDKSGSSGEKIGQDGVECGDQAIYL
jgi:hypothetical protein